MDALAKLLFPNHERWQRRRRLRTFLLGILLGLITSAIVGGFIYWQSVYKPN